MRPQYCSPEIDYDQLPEWFDLALEVWLFIASFAEPLKIFPFSLTEFVNAIEYEQEIPQCQLFNTVHAGMLNLLAKERINIMKEIKLFRAINTLEFSQEKPIENSDGNDKTEKVNGDSRKWWMGVAKDCEQTWIYRLVGCLKELHAYFPFPHFEELKELLFSNDIDQWKPIYLTLPVILKVSVLKWLQELCVSTTELQYI